MRMEASPPQPPPPKEGGGHADGVGDDFVNGKKIRRKYAEN